MGLTFVNQNALLLTWRQFDASHIAVLNDWRWGALGVQVGGLFDFANRECRSEANVPQEEQPAKGKNQSGMHLEGLIDAFLEALNVFNCMFTSNFSKS